jgi:methylated-DNA-[protein]-cysteine S-methyltransferase
MTAGYYVCMESPYGEIVITSNGKALTGLYSKNNSYFPDARKGIYAPKYFDVIVKQLNEYFLGKRQSFDLPLELEGTEFQKQVWDALLTIPYGVTKSYGEIAQQINNTKAVRAVGTAAGKNPIGIIVPCHRMIGANGSLTGYNGGIEVKKWLLQHEGAIKPGNLSKNMYFFVQSVAIL